MGKNQKTIDSFKSKHLYDAKYFLEKVDGYHEFKDFDGSFEKLFPRMKRNVEIINLKHGEILLDVGCGRGEIVLYYRKLGFNAYGIDYSEDAIKLAKQKQNEMNIKGEIFYSAPFQDLPKIFPCEYFDVIYASEFIEHISEDEFVTFLDISYELLKRGGRIILFTHPNTLYRKIGYPIRRFYNLIFKFRILPKIMPDQLDPHYMFYHINEQNYYKLKKRIEKKFVDINIQYDTLYKNMPLLKRTILSFPLIRHIFNTDILVVARKPKWIFS